MAETTPNIGLRKPLDNDSADIAVINENMDKIDQALGDMSSVPTTAKDAAGAISELETKISNIDITPISDSKIGIRTLSDNVAPTEDSGTVTGLLSRLAYMIKSITGKTNWRTPPRTTLENAVKLSGDTMSGQLLLSGDPTNDNGATRRLYVDQKFGAITTSGVLNWNDPTNTRPGTGYTLLMGNVPNGPGPLAYYHPFNFEYSTKNGNGTITQLAIPYDLYVNPTGSIMMRTRYEGVWSSWTKLWNTNELRVRNGQLEFFNNGVWLSVGERSQDLPVKLQTTNSMVVTSSRQTLLSVSGSGYLTEFSLGAAKSDYVPGSELCYAELYIDDRLVRTSSVVGQGTNYGGSVITFPNSGVLFVGTIKKPIRYNKGLKLMLYRSGSTGTFSVAGHGQFLEYVAEIS
jgi:hypothetical protein